MSYVIGLEKTEYFAEKNRVFDFWITATYIKGSCPPKGYPRPDSQKMWTLTRKNFTDEVRKSFWRQKQSVYKFCDKKVCVNCFRDKKIVLKSFLRQKKCINDFCAKKSVHTSFSRQKKCAYIIVTTKKRA